MVLDWIWQSPAQMSFKHKEDNSFHKRREEAMRARRLYPNMVPIVLEKFPGDSLDELTTTKLLVPSTATLTEFQFLIRKRLQTVIPPETALFFFVNGNTFMSMSQTMKSIYDEFHYEDFILYLSYCKEATFG